MEQQHHVVRRQTVELEVPDEMSARRLHEEVSHIQASSLSTVIDRCCSMAADPERVERIAHLSVDLGRLDPQDFERDLVTRLTERLPGAIAAQLEVGRAVARMDGDLARPGTVLIAASSATGVGDGQGIAGLEPDGTATTRPLELLAHFLRTGMLPWWWVQSTRPDLVADAVRGAVATAPLELVVLLRDLMATPMHLSRLVETLDDPDLNELVAFLSPDAAAVIAPSEVVAPLAASSVLDPRSPRRRRSLAWASIVQSALADTRLSATSLIRNSLARLAGTTGTDRTELADGALHAARDMASSPAAITGIEVATRRTGRGETITSPGGTMPLTDPTSGSHDRGSAEVRTDRSPPAGTTDQRIPVDANESADRGDIGTRPPVAADRSERQARSDHDPSRKSAASHEQTRDAGGAPGDLHDRGARTQDEETAMPAPSDGAVEPSRRPEIDVEDAARVSSAPRAVLDSSFGDSDRVEVNSAGLVLLVRFLDRLLDRLELVDRDGFVSTEAQHRAVGLLHFLATGDRTPTEYLTTLDKVLCGMRISDVLEFGEPVTDSEAEECSDLLAAVIEHAGVFGDLSPDGLRGTFLFRRGVLAAEDGLWVLRVAREPYDVVLDRLPWNFEWLAFPRMRAPMRIEW